MISSDRAMMRELKQQSVIKQRLAQAARRTGFSLPALVPVTYETLINVRKQLEEHLAGQLPDAGKMN